GDDGRDVEDARSLRPEPGQARRAAGDDRPAPEPLVLAQALPGDLARRLGPRERQQAARSRARACRAAPLELAGRRAERASEHRARLLDHAEPARETTGVVPAHRPAAAV